MTTAFPGGWLEFPLEPSAKKIEWFIRLLDDVTEKENFTTCSALDWFKATLIAANIDIDGITQEQANSWLIQVLTIWIDYCGGEDALLRRPAVGPSKELLELNAALGNWLNSDDLIIEQLMLHRIMNPRVPMKWPTSTEGAAKLFNASAKVIDGLKAIKKKTRGESAETRLQRGLYYLYTDVTGKAGLSDDGPAHRFVKTFAAEIDKSVDVPGKGFAVLVRKARDRDLDPLVALAQRRKQQAGDL